MRRKATRAAPAPVAIRRRRDATQAPHPRLRRARQPSPPSERCRAWPSTASATDAGHCAAVARSTGATPPVAAMAGPILHGQRTCRPPPDRAPPIRPTALPPQPDERHCALDWRQHPASARQPRAGRSAAGNCDRIPCRGWRGLPPSSGLEPWHSPPTPPEKTRASAATTGHAPTPASAEYPPAHALRHRGTGETVRFLPGRHGAGR
ncbi:hypothetical protein D9M71_453830 [compost metagenome]